MKLSYSEFKNLIKKGNSIIDFGSDHVLTPILFKTDEDLDNFIANPQLKYSDFDTIRISEYRKMAKEDRDDNIVIMLSHFNDTDVYNNYNICSFIDLYVGDYLRLDNFDFNYEEIAKSELLEFIE